MRKVLGAGLLMGLSASCATLHGINTPLTSLETPEVVGRDAKKRNKIRVEAHIHDAATFVYSPDVLTTPITPLTPTIAGFFITPSGDIAVGLADSWDAALKLGWTIPTRVQVKHQWLGNGRHLAKKGNFAVASLLAVLIAYDNKVLQDNTNGQAIDSTIWYGGDTQSSVGYRIIDPLFVYGGVSFTVNAGFATLSRTPIAGGTTIQTFHTWGIQTSTFAGVEFSPGIAAGIFFRLEGGAAYLLSGNAARFLPTMGLQAGLHI